MVVGEVGYIAVAVVVVAHNNILVAVVDRAAVEEDLNCCP